MKQQNNIITIEKLSHDGRGIGNINGKTHFIGNALIGETVKFNVLRKHKRFTEGFAHTILEEHPERISPRCTHFGLCGGCQIQHMPKFYQLDYKQKAVIELIEHIGQTTPKEILPPISAREFEYRTKARLGVKYVHKKEKVVVGFRELNGRYIADIEHCPILVPAVGTKLTALSALINELSCLDKIPQIEVAASNEVTALIFRHLATLTSEDISTLKQFGKEHHFMICLQSGGYETITQIYPTEGIPELHYDIPEHNMQIAFHPSDFTQVNYDVNLQMIDSAINLLALNSHDKVLDLFCGLGNFTLPISRHVHHITGIEGDKNMVTKAQINMDNNNVTNAEFYAANLFEDISNRPWAQKQYDKILLDPPRAGAHEIAKNIKCFGANTVVYISCNPATLARDTQEMTRQGYTLCKLGIINMFPQTAHVETIALFQK